jgi:hypothetical protein
MTSRASGDVAVSARRSQASARSFRYRRVWGVGWDTARTPSWVRAGALPCLSAVDAQGSLPTMDVDIWSGEGDCTSPFLAPPRRPEPRQAPPHLSGLLGPAQRLYLQARARRPIELLPQRLDLLAQGVSSGTFGVPIRLCLVPRRLGVFQPSLCATSIRVSRVGPPLCRHHVGPGGIEIALHGTDLIAQPVGPARVPG